MHFPSNILYAMKFKPDDMIVWSTDLTVLRGKILNVYTNIFDHKVRYTIAWGNELPPEHVASYSAEIIDKYACLEDSPYAVWRLL